MRSYLSDLHAAWPIPRQEALLDAGAPGWRAASVYRDTVTKGQRKARSVAALTQRATLLRPTRRQAADDVYVAAWPVLAWTAADLLTVLAALSTRGATLIVLDTGTKVLPTARAAELAEVCQEFERACRRVGDYGKSGGIVSGERRAAAAKAGCERIKERWGLPSADYPTRALLDEAGVSRPTAIAYLGRREDAQRAHQKSQAVAERNRKRASRRIDSEQT